MSRRRTQTETGPARKIRITCNHGIRGVERYTLHFAFSEELQRWEPSRRIAESSSEERVTVGCPKCHRRVSIHFERANKLFGALELAEVREISIDGLHQSIAMLARKGDR